MAVKLNSTGGGSVTLDSPSTASNYTVTLPSAAGTLATTTGTGSVFTNPTINGFTGDTSAITVGTTQFVKDTSGNIGIGTASPAYKLDVIGGIGISYSGAAKLSWNYSGQYLNWIECGGVAGNNYMRFATGNAEQMRLDSSGNLGIGTTGPSKKLEVFVSANSLQIESIVRNDQAGSGIAAIGFNVSSSAASETTSTKAGIGLVRQNTYGCGSLCFYNSATTSAGDFTTADERMRIDSSGNLSLGGTSGYGRFTVYPATTPTTTLGANQICIGEATFNSLYRLQIGYANYSGAYTGTIQTYAGGVARDLVVCGDGGNLGVGTTSPATILHTYSNNAGTPTTTGSATTGVSVRFQNSSINFDLGTYSSGTCFIQPRLVGNNASNADLVLNPNGGNVSLGASGSLTVPNIYTNTTAAVTYVAVSSAGLLQRGGVSALKYKQDIRDLESIDINKFRAVRYKSKCENDDQTIDYFGFIADEVDEAGIKELVIYDDAGEPEGFQYERMTVVLLKTIQELSAQNQALEARLAQLEAK
jgi:hypothetical protein